METLDIDGKTFEYECRGAGEPVILIHGSVVADSFLPLMEQHALNSHFRLVRYHRRGYIGSTHSPPPVSIADQAHDCVELMRQLGIDRAHLVGHSYGGVIALMTALEEPALVHTLSLLEPALIGLVPSGATLGAALAPAFMKYQSGDKLEALDIFLGLVSGEGYRAELEQAIPEALSTAAADASTLFDIEIPAIQEFWGTFSREKAMSIKQPALVMTGTASAPP